MKKAVILTLCLLLLLTSCSADAQSETASLDTFVAKPETFSPVPTEQAAEPQITLEPEPIPEPAPVASSVPDWKKYV